MRLVYCRLEMKIKRSYWSYSSRMVDKRYALCVLMLKDRYLPKYNTEAK